MDARKQLPLGVECDEPHGWQLLLARALSNEPDDRTIYWIWDRCGGHGHVQFVSWLCEWHDVLFVSGSAADMKHAVARRVRKVGPPWIVVIDASRSGRPTSSCEGIEEIKNGIFFSPKYRSCMVRMPHPHVVVLATAPPWPGAFSVDRCEIVCLDELDDAGGGE